MTGFLAKNVAAVTVLIALSASVTAQEQPAALQLALDKPVEMTIENATITEVFSQFSAATGIKCVVPEETLEFLPYGDQTRLSVTLKNVTPRRALTRMLEPHALRWEIKGDAVYVIPTEPLYRMSRRPTYDELKLLGTLHTARLKPTTEGGNVVEQLKKATGNKDLDVTIHGEVDKRAAFSRAERVLPGTPVAWLNMLTHGQQQTWYLSGDRIVVISKEAQVRRQLQRGVSLRYQNANLVTVLQDLAQKGRVKLTMDPGVLNYLPVEARTNFGLVMADASIEQALEVISGETGLKFIQTGEGVRVEASEKLKEGFRGTASRTRSPFFIRMSLPGPPGTDIEVFFRGDELPEELIEVIQGEKEKLILELTEKYLRKGPKGD